MSGIVRCKARLRHAPAAGTDAVNTALMLNVERGAVIDTWYQYPKPTQTECARPSSTLRHWTMCCTAMPEPLCEQVLARTVEDSGALTLQDFKAQINLRHLRRFAAHQGQQHLGCGLTDARTRGAHGGQRRQHLVAAGQIIEARNGDL